MTEIIIFFVVFVLVFYGREICWLSPGSSEKEHVQLVQFCI